MFRVALRTLVMVAAVLALVLFVSSALDALGAKRGADPVEQRVLDGASRFARGETIYQEPKSGGEPSILPGLPIALSVLSGDDAPSLGQLRALALGACLLAAILVALIVQMECSSWMLALVAGSFALMAQGMLTTATALALPHSFMLALILLGFMTIRHLPGVGGAFLGAIPIAAAVFVEPQASCFAAGAGFSLALERNRRFATFAITAGILLGAGYLALSRLQGPWFNFNAWDAPMEALRFSATGVLGFVGDHLLRTLGVWTMAALLSFAMTTEPWSGRCGLWMCLGLSAFLGGLASTQSRAFGVESLLPSIVVMSLVGPIMMQRVTRHLAAWKDPDQAGGENVIFAAAILQFVALLAAVPAERWAPGLARLWPVA